MVGAGFFVMRVFYAKNGFAARSIGGRFPASFLSVSLTVLGAIC
jgi:hypothetical protein